MKNEFAIAAKGIVIRDDKFLLLHRTPEEMRSSVISKKDPWDFPGGGIQFFETIETGLYREIKEETHLKIKLLNPLEVYDFVQRQLHIVIITYLVKYTSGEVELSEEHDAYYWLTPKEIDSFDVSDRFKVQINSAFELYNKIQNGQN